MMRELRIPIKDNVSLNQLKDICDKFGVEVAFSSGKGWMIVGAVTEETYQKMLRKEI